MSDPLRTDAARADVASASDRDAKIEQVLLAGLDQYFAGRYDHAINVWTRALFLDRNHPRSRAYIERARSALAERQRECEELLQHGVAAFDRGEPDEARRLLKKALNSGAPEEEALALLGRLDRLDPAPVPVRPPRIAPQRPPTRKSGQRPAADGARRAVGLWVGIGALVCAGSLLVAGSRPIWRSMFGALPQAPGSVPPAPSGESMLPLPRRGEIALSRAQALVAIGRLRDALAALDLVRPTDPEKPEADRLRSDIQHELIGLSTPATSSSDQRLSRRRP
jgi:tetratricopeptide (TPR) repeat protein